MYKLKTLCVFCKTLHTLLIDPDIPLKDNTCVYECDVCHGFIAELDKESDKKENLEALT